MEQAACTIDSLYDRFLIEALEIEYKPGFDIVTVEELIEIDVDHRVKKPEDRLHV